MNPAILVPIVVAIIAPLGAYLLAARKMSGRVDTSTATELWTESRAIRKDYREQLNEASDRTRQLEERVARLEGQNTTLVRENIELQGKVVQLESLVETLRETIDRLQGELKAERRAPP